MGDTPGGPFRKNDPRINRKGRPRSFDALRALGQQIAHEEATSGGKPVVIEGHICSVTEVILRQWAQSKNPVLQQKFIEITYGKVPDKIELTGKGGGPIETRDADVVRKLLPELDASGAPGAAKPAD